MFNENRLTLHFTIRNIITLYGLLRGLKILLLMKKGAILIVYLIEKYIPLEKVSWTYRAKMVSFQSSQASAGPTRFQTQSHMTIFHPHYRRVWGVWNTPRKEGVAWALPRKCLRVLCPLVSVKGNVDAEFVIRKIRRRFSINLVNNYYFNLCYKIITI